MKSPSIGLDVAARVGQRFEPTVLPTTATTTQPSLQPADHLGDLALALRDEFLLGNVIDETGILASLQQVAAGADAAERWLALFNSPLGAALRSRGRDLNTAMGFVLAQLPRRAS